jgi:hypothetical protein
MAIYRSDQAVVTFGAEAALGGYIEGASGSTVGSTASSTVATAKPISAGDQSFTITSATDFAVGQYIIIGTTGSTNSQKNTEVRRLVSISGTTFYLDAPCGFNHGAGQLVKDIVTYTDTANDKYITYIPGVYDTVTTPDMTPTIEPRYFLGTGAKRNFTAAYKGTQAFNGSIPSFILLNGWPLRFPIGKMNTTISGGSTDTPSTIKAGATAGGSGGLGAKKGDTFIALTVSSHSNIAVHDFIQIGSSPSTYEVNRVVAKSTELIQLATPLKADHAAGVNVAPMTGTGATNYFTHTITETNELDSISMDVHLKDSGETAANDFNRRYYGGKVGAATIAAEEGGLLVMGWDTIPFMGGVHNQKLDSFFVDAGDTEKDLPFFTHFNPSSDSQIGSRGVSGDATSIAYPTQDPYYFSEGSVKLFGQTFARVRNFSISINNNVEPRYYIERRGDSRNRGPSDIVEMRREYTMTATIALPDSEASATGNTASLFKELMLEGDYGAPDGTNKGMKGFDIQLVFNKGTVMTGVTGVAIASIDHKMTIDIPTSGDPAASTTAATGLNTQGAYLTEAPHPIDGSNPLEVSVSLIFRNMGITIVDNVGLYP